ncbi:3-dehydro-L-gulonate 2-dehydrogenase [Pelobacter seleniigenes]|uniref:3-dehydro-L-gulonate 2-dehydrogenase n=1 Tax=Pelobacter seleniigenes TaxID=407188 RepID=UPI00068AE355|nr:3-dehydro-L-gulonate 2-dehydrogenase [Pelobacter seleniigenes]
MTSIQRLPFAQIQQELSRILLELGLATDKAQRCAEIFTQNSCDGVASHGLNRFPAFVEAIKSGLVDIKAESERVSFFGAMEQWDGQRGIGLLNAERAMQRALHLAREHGIGCVGLRNTNHWMRGGTYGLLAAEAGCIGICWTNTMALLPPWGAAEKKIGNNPLVIAIPNGESPILLDMAMSQFSNGKLEVLRRRGEQLPLVGGYDQNGDLTTDPDAILQSRRALPIGFWKGSGLAFALDLLAALISAGDTTTEISRRGPETGVSQVFIAIDSISRAGSAADAQLQTAIAEFLATPSLDGGAAIRYPGQGMLATRQENLRAGIPVETDLWEAILRL